MSLFRSGLHQIVGFKNCHHLRIQARLKHSFYWSAGQSLCFECWGLGWVGTSYGLGLNYRARNKWVSPVLFPFCPLTTLQVVSCIFFVWSCLLEQTVTMIGTWKYFSARTEFAISPCLCVGLKASPPELPLPCLYTLYFFHPIPLVQVPVIFACKVV